VVWELLRSDEKCVLVDLRGEDRAAGLIEGAVHVPAMGSVAFVTKVPDLVRAYGDQSFVIFTCQYSVHRAPQCANWYREKANPQQRVGILSGGFRGWEARGLPVVSPADGKLKGSMADHFAMQQGLRFVQQHAPQVYERAERQNKPQLEELLQPLRQATKTVTQAQAQAHTQAQMQQAQAQHAQPQPQPHSQRQVRVHARKYQPPHLPNTVPTKAGVEHLDPGTVHELLQDRKCVLVDLRGEDRAAGLIEGAVPVPAIGHIPFIAKVPTLVKKFVKDDLVVFTCQYSAHRAPQCANWYREKANSQQRVAILSGGFRGWEAEGLPVVPCTGSALDTSAADEFAMSQGVSFVKQYAPKIYQQAQQRQRQQQQQQQDDAHSADHSIASKEEPSSRSQHESSSRSQQHSLPATEKVQLRSQQSQARSRAPSEGAPYFTHTHGSHFERSPERDHGSEMGERAHREPPPPPSRTVGRSSGHAGRGVSQDVSGRHTRSNQQSHGQSRRHQLESQSRSHARADRSQTPTHGGLAKRQGQAQTQAHPQAQTRSRTPTKASAPPQSEVAPQSPHAPPHLPSSVAPPPPHATPHLPNTVPTIAGVEHLEPEEVFEMMWSKECTLVDVRGEDRSAGLIEGALHVPAIDKVMFPSKVPELVHRFKSESLVVFTCQYSAHRAPQCANWYREQAEPKQRVAILVGGFRGWEAQGFPVNQAAVTAEQAASADKFAMRQGVGFVKRYAPEVYQQARQLQQKQKELQHQLQKQQQQLQKQQQHHEQQLQKQQQQQEQKLQQQQREHQREQLQKELQKQQQQREQQKQQQQQEQHQHQLQQQQLLQQQQQILQQQQQQQQMQQQQLQQQHHQLQQQQQQQQQQQLLQQQQQWQLQQRQKQQQLLQREDEQQAQQQRLLDMQRHRQQLLRQQQQQRDTEDRMKMLQLQRQQLQLRTQQELRHQQQAQEQRQQDLASEEEALSLLQPRLQKRVREMEQVSKQLEVSQQRASDWLRAQEREASRDLELLAPHAHLQPTQAHMPQLALLDDGHRLLRHGGASGSSTMTVDASFCSPRCKAGQGVCVGSAHGGAVSGPARCLCEQHFTGPACEVVVAGDAKQRHVLGLALPQTVAHVWKQHNPALAGLLLEAPISMVVNACGVLIVLVASMLGCWSLGKMRQGHPETERYLHPAAAQRSHIRGQHSGGYVSTSRQQSTFFRYPGADSQTCYTAEGAPDAHRQSLDARRVAKGHQEALKRGPAPISAKASQQYIQDVPEYLDDDPEDFGGDGFIDDDYEEYVYHRGN